MEGFSLKPFYRVEREKTDFHQARQRILTALQAQGLDCPYGTVIIDGHESASYFMLQSPHGHFAAVHQTTRSNHQHLSVLLQRNGTPFHDAIYAALEELAFDSEARDCTDGSGEWCGTFQPWLEDLVIPDLSLVRRDLHRKHERYLPPEQRLTPAKPDISAVAQLPH